MRTGRAEMSWSKNVFCYVMWFLYTLLTGIALAGVGGVLCGRAGVQTYWGILFAILILAVTGGIDWLFRRFGAVLSLWGKKRPGGKRLSIKIHSYPIHSYPFHARHERSD